MVAPLLRTKLYISPLQGEIVPRTRLINRLNAAMERKFTLISAPAGFGKTMLLREWISATKLPFAWLSLDAGDNDSARFWVYVIAALQTVHENVGAAVSAALQNPQPPPLESLITELINEIAGSTLVDAGRSFALVLDDYHLITERQVHDTLTFLLENLPPQIHLILSCRADPPWQLARLRTRREMTEIRLEDLRFTSHEAAIFLNDVMGLTISPDEISVLETRTEGWIAGLQLAAISMQGRDDILGFVNAFSGSHRFILDYLVEEVLCQQPDDVQSFLLQTSILEQMNASLCDAVTGQVNSPEMLRRLEDANLFLISLDDQRHWYRYHHLFSELLRNQLSVIWPDDVPVLHKRASQWFEDQGYVDESIDHAFTAKDFERLPRLIEKYAMNMLQQNKHSQLSAWIEALPEDIVRSRPWLCVYQSWTRHWAGIREGGEECLENAERLLMSSSICEDDQQILTGYIATVRSHYALINGEISRVIEQADKALSVLPAKDYYARGTAAVALGGAYWGNGDLSGAEKAFADCASVALKGGYSYRASSALCYQGMMQVRQGKLEKADSTYRNALILAQDVDGRRFPVAGYALAKLAELACEWNHLEQAYISAQEGVKLCDQLGHVDLMAEASAALARVQLTQGDLPGVRDSLRKIDQLALKTALDPWAVCWLDDCRVGLWLATGEIDQAIRWAEESSLLAGNSPNFHADLPTVILARIWVTRLNQQSDQTDQTELFHLLDRLLEVTEEAGWVHHQIQILILKVLSLHAVDDIDQALEVITQTLEMAEPSGYLRVFVNAGEPIRDLLALMLERNHASLPESRSFSSAYINKILAVFEKAGKDQGRKTVDQSGLCEPLTPRELEILTYLTTNLTVPEIARELVVSANTVRSHIKRIYGKLGVGRRMSAVKKARELKLV